MNQILQKCGTEHTVHHETYTLKLYHGQYDRTEIHILRTNDNVDAETAATHALFYACWASDIELVRWILDDLRELININTQLDDKGILERTLPAAASGKTSASHRMFREEYNPHLEAFLVSLTRTFRDGLSLIRQGHLVYKEHSIGVCTVSVRSFEKHCLDEAINICRLLIIYYGSKLSANYPSVLQQCVHGNCADVVAYLVVTYGSGLDLEFVADEIFECLVKGREDEAAELYLRLHMNRIASPFSNIITHAAHDASFQLFMVALDLYSTQITPGNMNRIFCMLCDPCSVLDRYAKVEAALRLWSSQLLPETIDMCLINCWWETMNELSENSGGSIGQMIVMKYIDRPHDSWTEGAMVVCCCSPQNLELLEDLIDRNLAKICLNPKLMGLALVQTSKGDIEALNLILTKCGSCLYPDALLQWSEVGDLEGVTLILELGKGCCELTDCIPQILFSTCRMGDTELAELLIRYAGDSILGSDYHRAFQLACCYAHTDIVEMLANYRNHSDFRPETNYDLNLTNIEPDIIVLLNSIFGTRLDPKMGGQALSYYAYYQAALANTADRYEASITAP